MTTLRERLDQVLKDNAVDSVENQGLHGWRCRYPEAYGACNCYETLLDELVSSTTRARPGSRFESAENADTWSQAVQGPCPRYERHWWSDVSAVYKSRACPCGMIDYPTLTTVLPRAEGERYQA